MHILTSIPPVTLRHPLTNTRLLEGSQVNGTIARVLVQHLGPQAENGRPPLVTVLFTGVPLDQHWIAQSG